MSWKEVTINVDGKEQKVLMQEGSLCVFKKEDTLRVGQQFTMLGKSHKVVEVVDYANRGEVFTITFEGKVDGNKKQKQSEPKSGGN